MVVDAAVAAIASIAIACPDGPQHDWSRPEPHRIHYASGQAPILWLLLSEAIEGEYNNSKCIWMQGLQQEASSLLPPICVG